MNILEIFSSVFFLNALVACLLSSVASGIIGSYVVTKRIVFLAGSIAHSVLSGMGLFLWLKKTYHIEWLEPIYGAFLASLFFSFIIGWVHLRFNQRKDAIIASIWAFGMAVGVIFISLTPGFNVELFNFLFGNILWVGKADLMMLAILNVCILFLVWLFYHPFLAICFDDQQAQLQKIPVQTFYFILLALISLTIVVLIQIIGIILVLALLALPAMIASLFTHKFSTMMALSVLFCGILTFFGLIFSYELNWPSGATIALTTTGFYILLLLFKRKAKKFFCKICSTQD